MAHIVGIGIDMVSISRISAAMSNPRFVSRILRPEETPFSLSAEWLAGRWAAKEAIAKAVSTTLTWQDVSIITESDGRPTVKFHIKTPFLENIAVHLSISHERSEAIAMVVAEKLG